MEGLRGIAVILVFLQHFAVQAQLAGLPDGPTAFVAGELRKYGNVGVELFFVLSGYLIYGTLVTRRPPFGRFMARRARRIYPVFLVVFTAMAMVNLLDVTSGKIPADPWLASLYLGANLLLLPGLLPVVPVVEVAWSLSYEMFFYVATAGLVLGTGFRRLHSKGRLLVLWGLLAGFVAASFMDIPGFPERMMPFFAGMLLAEGMGERVPAWLGWAAPGAAFLVSVTDAISGPALELFHTGAFFLLCAVCFRSRGIVSVWMTWAPLRWLGNMSYSYYLMHGSVVRVGMLAMAKHLHGGLSDGLFWALLPTLFAATLVASAVMFVLVEKPLSLAPAGSRRPMLAVREKLKGDAL